MHHLEESIAEWRSRMQSAPNLGPDALDELESHLREIVEQQVRAGTDESEAFQRAVAQLGSAAKVATEFQKLKSPVWLPVKVARFSMGFTAVALLCLIMLSFHHQGRFDWLMAVHVLVINLGFVAALELGVLGICFVCQRSWSDFSNRRIESVCRSVRAFTHMSAWLVAMGIILGMVFEKKVMGFFWSWNPKEIGALCILLWLAGLLAAHRFRWVTPRGLLTAGVLSINFVVLGWLVPNLIPSGLHSYGAPGYGPLVIGEGVGLLFFLIGLAPPGWLRLRRKAA